MKKQVLRYTLVYKNKRLYDSKKYKEKSLRTWKWSFWWRKQSDRINSDNGFNFHGFVRKGRCNYLMKWPINCKTFGATSAKTEVLLAGATAHWRFQYQSWICSPSLALLSRTSRLRKNEQNGQRLLELCSLRNLCITYTFFDGKPQHCVSWKPPRSHRWHQLDLLITRPRSLLNVLSIRSYHSADCNTDHVLVCNSTARRNQAIPA